MALFTEMKLSQPVMRALEEMGFESATAIQSETIPVALTGQDLIGQAQTGTGKTVAFSIPLVETIDVDNSQVQGLIVTPTRELCIQVADEVSRLSQFKKVRVLSLYGGQDITRQIRALKQGPHVIVCTPGRMIDHLNRRTVKLHSVRMVILDEADEMLDMGFVEDIETILSHCPQERQTLLFSATMKAGVKALASKFMRDMQQISVKSSEVTVPSIEQIFYEVQERKKLDVLTRLLDIQNPELAIVFGRTKRRVDELIHALQTRGYVADGLHGDMSQRQRDLVMRKFRDRDIDVLIATDVAARGLDVTGVTHVYNFDMPQDVDSYVHRIGRTGRAGTSGVASTFVTPPEMEHLHLIERVTKRRIEKRAIPTVTEARVGKHRVAMERLAAEVNHGDLSGFRILAQELLEDYDSVALVSSAIRLLTNTSSEVPVTLTAERPVRIKRPSYPSAQNRAKQSRFGHRHSSEPRGAGHRTRRNFKQD